MRSYANEAPNRVRKLISEEKITGPTSGMCNGFAQANLVILPKKYSDDFKRFANLNSKACPVLEILEAGEKHTKYLANNANIASELPKYRIYKNGAFHLETTNIESYWQDDFVSFLIGCSFTFEAALMASGIEVRHIAMNRNVPMYKTNIMTVPAGRFSGPIVVSMRPIRKDQIDQTIAITSEFPEVHGAPIHIGNPLEIGISDLNSPDYGDAVSINEDEIPVFWACGVTPQAAVENAKPEWMITHAPGHMFIADLKNESLKGICSKEGSKWTSTRP
jgi:uncharacterized protein YcsI (UPF0317 family)